MGLIRRLLPAAVLLAALALPGTAMAAAPAEEIVLDRAFIVEIFLSLITIVAMAALAAIVGILWPKQLSEIGRSIAGSPVMAGGVGLLTVGVVVPVVLIAALTLILIPVSIAAIAVLIAAAVFGWIALGMEIVRRIGAAAGQDWNPAVAAGFGAVLLGFVFLGLDRIPCVGWTIQAVVGLVGLGAVVVTWFGTRPEEEGSKTLAISKDKELDTDFTDKI